MKKRLFTVLTVLAAFTLMVPLAGAQEKPKDEGGCCPMRHQLNLTDDQEKQVEKSKFDLEKAVLPLETQIEVKHAELKALLVADNPNAGTVNAKLDEIGGLRTQIQKKRVAHEMEVRRLLTPEQRLQFDRRVLKGFDRMEMMHKRGCGPMGGRGCGMQGRVKEFLQQRREGMRKHPVIEKEEKIEIRKEKE
jgi:Spy/CpxP family protein refolding chaperone